MTGFPTSTLLACPPSQPDASPSAPQPKPTWSQAMLVADFNDTENFSQDAQLVHAQVPPTLQVTDVFASSMTSTQVELSIVTSINSGELLVNYMGHGSEDQWSGSNFFNQTTVDALTNGSSLPVFLIMNCL